LHPPKLRIYGWAPAKDAFAAITWAFETDTKADKSLNDKKRDEVVTFIKENGLEHTIMMGDNSEVYPTPHV
jgi:hypothetical protein